MFAQEAHWLAQKLAVVPDAALTPLLNIGSSDRRFREEIQPWIGRDLLQPLAGRGIQVINIDQRDGDGIDVRADVLDERGMSTLRDLGGRAVLCCNILEHVLDPGRLARNCLELVPSGGLVFVTVPYSYPYHRDPIDTLFRPTPEEIAALFPGTVLVEGEILTLDASYRDEVRRRPWILFRHIARLPFPFIFHEKWKRSMRKLYWLVHSYRVTCAVLRKV